MLDLSVVKPILYIQAPAYASGNCRVMLIVVVEYDFIGRRDAATCLGCIQVKFEGLG